MAVASRKTIEAKAKQVQANLESAGYTGIDWQKLIDLITKFLPMLLACFASPAKAHQHVQMLANGQSYVGSRLHNRRLDNMIASSGVVTGEGDCPCNVGDVKAAMLDMASGTSQMEFAQAADEAE